MEYKVRFKIFWVSTSFRDNFAHHIYASQQMFNIMFLFFFFKALLLISVLLISVRRRQNLRKWIAKVFHTCYLLHRLWRCWCRKQVKNRNRDNNYAQSKLFNLHIWKDKFASVEFFFIVSEFLSWLQSSCVFFYFNHNNIPLSSGTFFDLFQIYMKYEFSRFSF